MTTKEKIEVMQAYLNGKKIQFKEIADDTWEDCSYRFEPDWNWSVFRYRVKPEKEKPRLMTHRQLAEWLAKGNGQLRIMGNCETFTYLSYFFTSSLSDIAEVCDSYLIRSWDSDDWVEPAVDIYERDCKGGK